MSLSERFTTTSEGDGGDVALLDAFAAVMRAPEGRFAREEDAATILRARGVDEVDVVQSLEGSRFALYRRLVQGRFRGALEVSLPRTLARLGEARTTLELKAFLSERASSSPYLRDVASEFVDFVGKRWSNDAQVPAYLVELARHELLAFEVAAGADDAPNGGDSSPHLDIAERVAFQQAARLARYGHAVHRLPESEEDASVADVENVALLAYRDAERRVRFLELSRLGAALVERLQAGGALGEATLAACAQCGVEADDGVLASLAVLLQDLEERGVIVGSIPGTKEPER